ncbi:MAG: MazG family protein, partial [Sphingobium sp.]
FTLQQVVDGITAKMTRRHPHVFGDQGQRGDGNAQWENIKAAERADRHADTSALGGVALALPALLRAEKIQKRAARTGFDWPDTRGVIDKINEELDEVRAATTAAQQQEEVGDLLFSVVNLARHLKVDAETALRGANAKFERRFRAMEAEAGTQFADLPLDAKEVLWQQVKRGG